MAIQDALTAGFVILILMSGVLAKLCKEELLDEADISGLWIFSKDKFTKRGKTLRSLFFISSNLSIAFFFSILIIAEQST